ncbi:unnamed protein product [Bursaphelenchus okinawaensis]|uniref:Uncharacterized protein n=1 Tax=Bursaphelenchus okinawaensis TaxID=465554 RepID=A0A811LHQ8_9BILA|nr:unnamed protein product [Bursaphelenchus okinawaensis]CAG9122282.1 unnamed protein product [Bursaphelenchus okinawaensis]
MMAIKLLFQQREETKDLMASVYVDNFVLTYDSAEEALKETERIRSILAEAKFTLTQFCSNDPHVQAQLSADPSPTITQVLGTSWDVGKDELKYEITTKTHPKLTKRLAFWSHSH